VDHLALGPGTHVLDLGCGTGRHARAIAERGIPVTGVDVAERFVQVAHAAGSPARFVRGDARRLPLADGAADVVVSLCQGAFGLTGGPAAVGVPEGLEPDEVVLGEAHRVLRPGGMLALTAFSSYFSLRDLGGEETFDAEAGVLHERTELRDESGATVAGDLWTTCYTPRELRLLLRLCGFAVEHLWSVRPGRYATGAATVASPEYLVVARRSG
jgi:SAM-dependent methyltransferase